MDDIAILERLAVALAAGLIVGFERGWHEREAAEGARVAGLRTFAFIGAYGGLVATIGQDVQPLIAAAMTLALGGFFWTARPTRASMPDLGATTEVVAFVTFGLGGLAGLGHEIAATAGAVVSALLLSMKGMLHTWLRDIRQQEFFAALQLLLISIVFLPLLPDRGFGPYAALNPYQIWWMVVLVAGLSFAGYVAMRVLGPESGVIATALLGGLVSSTATTLALARHAKDLSAETHATLAAGIIASWTIMLVRMGIEAAVVYPPLARALMIPFGMAAILAVATAVWLWRRRSPVTDGAPELGSPLSLPTALGFGVFLAIVMLLSRAFTAEFGESALYGVAAMSGLADVDAITLSVADLAAKGTPMGVAVGSITLAAAVNTIVKATLALAIAPASLARRAAVGLLAILAGGAMGFAIGRPGGL